MRRSTVARTALGALFTLSLSTMTACGAEKVPPNLLAGWGSGPATCGEYTVSVAMVDSAKDEARDFQLKIDGKEVAVGTLENKTSAYVKTFKTSKASTKVQIGEILGYDRTKNEYIVQPAASSPMTVTVTPCPQKAKKK